MSSVVEGRACVCPCALVLLVQNTLQYTLRRLSAWQRAPVLLPGDKPALVTRQHCAGRVPGALHHMLLPMLRLARLLLTLALLLLPCSVNLTYHLQSHNGITLYKSDSEEVRGGPAQQSGMRVLCCCCAPALVPCMHAEHLLLLLRHFAAPLLSHPHTPCNAASPARLHPPPLPPPSPSGCWPALTPSTGAGRYLHHDAAGGQAPAGGRCRRQRGGAGQVRGAAGRAVLQNLLGCAYGPLHRSGPAGAVHDVPCQQRCFLHGFQQVAAGGSSAHGHLLPAPWPPAWCAAPLPALHTPPADKLALPLPHAALWMARCACAS